MNTTTIIVEIDAEIDVLKRVKNILSGQGVFFSASAPKHKRVLSPEAREKIAAAQRKRWAAQKKAAK